MPNTRSEWARSYLERGWSPIPLKPDDKAPLSAGWQRQKFTAEQIDGVFDGPGNNGLILGPASNNLLDIDLDCPEAVRAAPWVLPHTGLVFGRLSKPNSHYMYEADPSDTIRRVTYFDVDMKTILLEIRGEGHQTMVPPSVHPDGEILDWTDFSDAGQTTVAELEKKAGFLAALVLMGRHWGDWDHRRHFVALHLSGGLLRAGFPLEVVKRFLKATCALGGKGDWEDIEKAVDSTFEKLEAGTDEVTGFPKLAEVIGNDYVKRLIEWLQVPSNADKIPNTDHGNALRFALEYGNNLRYAPDWGHWLIWDGTRWKEDKAERVFGFVRELHKSMYAEVAKEPDDTKKEALAKWAVRSQDVSRMNATLRVAKTDDRFLIESTDLDTDPWLLNAPNGTINLMTGGLQAHDPRDLISKSVPVPFDPDATCPRWLEYLLKVQDGNQDMVDFIQRLLGYSLTGVTTEQVFVLMWGPPGTGKSTFIETIRRVFGEYSANAEPETFMAKKQNSRATPELARLQGARLVTASETEQNERLAIARVKHMTGSDTMTASNLYAAPFEFRPVLKLWLSTNHKPRVPADEGGIWDRMIFIPFTVDMRNSPERVKEMAEILTEELPGILTWAVEGCQIWRRDGLGRPPQVTEAQSEYRNDSDEIGAFMDEMVQTGDGFSTPSNVLYGAYKEWAIAGSYHPKNVKMFKEKMEARGYKSTRTNAGVVWKGLQLHPTDPDVVVDLNATGRSSPFGRPRRAG